MSVILNPRKQNKREISHEIVFQFLSTAKASSIKSISERKKIPLVVAYFII